MIMENNYGSNIVNNSNLVTINIFELIKNLKTRKEARWFCQSNGKFLLVII